MVVTGKVNHKKILFVHDYPPTEGGGIEVSVYKTALALKKEGFNVKIATSRISSETFVSNKEVFNCEIDVALVKNNNDLSDLISWCDVLHIYFTFSFRPASMQALKIGAQMGVKTIFSVRTSHEHIPFSAMYGKTELELENNFEFLRDYAQNDNVIISGPTNALSSTLEFLGIDKELKVVKNGTDMYPNNEVAKTDISNVDITYIGELSFMKGINYLLDSIRMLNNNGDKVSLRLIGSGSDSDTMFRLAKFYNMLDFVEFTGYIKNSEIPLYLDKTKLYVQPSLTELWSNSVLEALSSGIPCISTSVGGMSEMLKDGEWGTLIDPGDSMALANSIKDSLENFDLLKNKHFKIQSLVQSEYSLVSQINSLKALYN